MKDDGAVSSPANSSKADGQGFAPGMLIAKRYRLDRPLGKGGMGVVWAATHTVTRRSVAIKFLRTESHRHSPELRQRFMREARAASAVTHPNVVTVSDVFELDDETPVMVMDLLTGETLGQKLTRESKLSIEETIAILLPVISAVGTAHALGIIHRDLKPDNIFILEGAAPGENVRVLDFGIAKLTELEEDSEATGVITNTGAVLGTPCYMSPEQALGEPDIDHRTDIWALGVIFYECLTGARPIQGDSVGQIVKQMLSDGVRPIGELEGDLPLAITNLIGRMLSNKRSRRPPDLNRVVEVLGKYTPIVVPAFGPPEQPADWLPDTDDERETRLDRKGGKPPNGEGPMLDTGAAQALSNGHHRRRRSMFALAIGTGLVLLGASAVILFRGSSATMAPTSLLVTPDATSRSGAAVTATPAESALAALPEVSETLPASSRAVEIVDAGAGASRKAAPKFVKNAPLVATAPAMVQTVPPPAASAAAPRTTSVFDNRKW